jgi:hypothetical protein
MREIEALYGEKTETRDEGAQKRAYEVLKEQSYQRGGFDSRDSNEPNELRNLDFIHPLERSLAARALNLDPQFLSADAEVFREVLSEADNLEFLRERLQGFSSRWAELHEFILAKKKWPNQRAEEDSEKSLAGWVGTQGGQREVYELLSDEAKALVQPPEKPKTKDERLQELHEFILAKKRWPSNSAEGLEKKLANWVGTQGGQREVYELLSDEAKALVQPAERQTKDERLQELNEFILEHQRWPKQGATEGSEKSLANWVNNQGGQREVYELLSDEAKALVQPAEKPKTRDERLQELHEFILAKKRWPNRTSAEDSERSLAIWVSHQTGQAKVYELLSDEAKALLGSPCRRNLEKISQLQAH